jgi:hypothetical protein
MTVNKVTILKALVSLALSTASEETKTDMMRNIDYGFGKSISKEYELKVQMIQAAPTFDYDNDSKSDCTAYLEFKQESEDLSVVVALQGTWSSYNGYQFSEFYFCKATPVAKVEYVRE